MTEERIHAIPTLDRPKRDSVTRNLLTSCLAIACCAVAVPAAAQQPVRAADLTTEVLSLQEGIAVGATLPSGATVFRGYDDDHGYEPWVSDGSAFGTRLLADLEPGPASSDPEDFTVHEGAIYFSATLLGEGRELWTTDGTSANVSMIGLFPGPVGSVPSQFTSHGSDLYFVGRTLGTGFELQRLDGSGSIDTFETIPGTASGNPRSLTPRSDRALYLRMTTPTTGEEPYLFNPSTEQFHLIADLEPGTSGSAPRHLTILAEDRLALSAESTTTGSELMIFDPVSGEAKLFDIDPAGDSSPRELVAFEGGLLFFATTSETGEELFWWSPATEKPQLVIDLAPGPDDGVLGDLFFAGKQVVFAGFHGAAGFEPTSSQGTPESTVMLADFNPGASWTVLSDGAFDGGKTLYLEAFRGADIEILETEGTSVKLLASLSGFGSLELTATGSGEVWGSTRPLPGGAVEDRLLRVDAGAADEIGLFGTTSSAPRDLSLGRTSDELLMSARSANGREPWVWNQGSAPFPIGDLAPGEADSDPSEFTPLGDAAFFAAEAADLELYQWDGVDSTAVRLHSAVPTAPQWIVPLGEQILFQGQANTGPRLVGYRPADSSWDSLTSDAVGLEKALPAGDIALFVKNSPPRLWRTDGTSTGTDQVDPSIEIDATGGWGAVSTPQNGATPLRFYFAGTEPATGKELYVTDGTAAGTEPVDFVLGANGLEPKDLTAGPGGRVAFLGRIGSSSRMMVSDGTTEGTVVVSSSGAIPLWVVGATDAGWFYVASDHVRGIELWFTDGTAGNSVPLDLDPEGSSMNPSRTPVVIHDSLLYFSAKTPDRGYELWRSDGTIEGTKPLTEIVRGAGGQDGPIDIVLIGDLLVASANGMDGAGQELWAARLGFLFEDGFDSGDLSAWSETVP